MTAAAAIGTTQADVDVFVVRLVKAYRELRDKWSKAAAAVTAAAAARAVVAGATQQTAGQPEG